MSVGFWYSRVHCGESNGERGHPLSRVGRASVVRRDICLFSTFYLAYYGSFLGCWAVTNATLTLVSFHHVHIRKRIYKNLEKYPNPRFFKRVLDYVMYFVAVAAPLALLPQVLQLFETRDVSSLSLPTWTLLCCINLIWTLYGLVHKEVPITIANGLMAILNGTVVYGILLYR